MDIQGRMRTGFTLRRHIRHAALWLFCCTAVGSPASDVFRWQGNDGITVYSDTPPSNTPITRIALDLPPVTGQVEFVIDGDTVIMHGGERVRLLGINAPEVAHHNRPGEPLGEEAREALQRLVTGKHLTLQFDRERRDHYGRLLAYLFLEDGRLVNSLLLEQGWVHVSLHWPNLKYDQAFMQKERLAREAGRGIWALEHFHLHPVKKAKDMLNTFARFKGDVTRVRKYARGFHLDFGNTLIATIPKERLALFTSAGVEPGKLKGRTLIIRGWVRGSRSVTRLYLEHPLQLESLSTLKSE